MHSVNQFEREMYKNAGRLNTRVTIVSIVSGMFTFFFFMGDSNDFSIHRGAVTAEGRTQERARGSK